MRYFPIFIDLEAQPVLVVGGTEMAAQKVRLLLKSSAKIHVISEAPLKELKDLAGDGRISLSYRRFQEADLEGCRLVYVATGDMTLNSDVSDAAKRRNIPVNVVDAPDHCSFITPAIVDRDPVTVAIGTEGQAPLLAREIKAQLDRWLPANYGGLARFAGLLRQKISEQIADGRVRRRLWERLLSGPFRAHVLAGKEDAAHLEVKKEMARIADEKERPEHPQTGRVSLVGSGPGDPDLLTLKAQQVLQSADVLVIDRLVNPDILDYARRDAIRIYVGKTPGKPSPSQQEINQILIREAFQGREVVRLKGGDPFVFGRAVEEMKALQAVEIEVQVVAGLTAAHGCAASIGLPLTSRGRHRKFSLFTGSTAEDIENADWLPDLVRGEAIAIYMGVRTAHLIRQRILEAGFSKATPVVIVEKGTLADERVILTEIEALEDCIEDCEITGPAIIFVGLDWAEIGLIPPDKLEYFERQKSGSFESHRRKMAVAENWQIG